MVIREFVVSKVCCEASGSMKLRSIKHAVETIKVCDLHIIYADFHGLNGVRNEVYLCPPK